ncbi:MAG: type I-E CRISPR-associated protein Cse1/CasA [Planctomycetia bacterium]|nr:type I-E CRISPR-associated protein Cse1/CasA [Planctomycetia bacterium]
MVEVTEMAENRSFNLCRVPWIPIAGHGEVSLREIFAVNPNFRRIGGTPVETVVLTRLLLAIVHACCPVKDRDDWKKLTPETISRNALTYLEKWEDRFDIYDEERPFLQFPQLKGNCTANTLAAVSLTVARGNKSILTQWNVEQGFTDAETARLLLIGTAYGCGGKKYDKATKVDPTTNNKGASGKQGTLTGYAGYLHSFLLGETVLETLWLNILTEKEVKEVRVLGENPEMGCPFWEEMPTGEENDSALRYRKSYQGVLFPIDKFLCLWKGQLLMTEGIAYPTHKVPLWDPSMTIFQDKKDWKAVWCNPNKKPWRQLDALLQFIVTKNHEYPSPAFLSLGFKRLLGCEKQNLGVWVGGIAIKSNSGEQYVSGDKDYVCSEFVIDWEWVQKDDACYQAYCGILETLAEYAKILYSATSRYFKEMNDAQGTAHADTACQNFWEKMEPLAQSIVELAADGTPEEIEKEQKRWQRIAASCYDDCCGRDTARQIQAYVKGLPRFNVQKGKMTKKTKKGGVSDE